MAKKGKKALRKGKKLASAKTLAVGPCNHSRF